MTAKKRRGARVIEQHPLPSRPPGGVHARPHGVPLGRKSAQFCTVLVSEAPFGLVVRAVARSGELGARKLPSAERARRVRFYGGGELPGVTVSVTVLS